MARLFVERRDSLAMDDELRRVFQRLLDGNGADALNAECTPPLDVIETSTAVEVVMDVPGLALQDLSIVFLNQTLVIMGRKLPAACDHHHAAFHLAERTFGRFARAVRLTGAFDTGCVEATLRAGELRLTLPRIAERRGAELRIPVRAD
jgi:HSP20 family protein